MPRDSSFVHLLSVDRCPECNHDLRRADGLSIEFVGNDERNLGRGDDHVVSVPGHPDVVMIDDDSGQIECGLHGETFCGGCGESLVGYEWGESYPGRGDKERAKAVEKGARYVERNFIGA